MFLFFCTNATCMHVLMFFVANLFELFRKISLSIKFSTKLKLKLKKMISLDKVYEFKALQAHLFLLLLIVHLIMNFIN